MSGDVRKFFYDNDTGLEAYFFNGISQPFPNHFHEHYVIGEAEAGKRHMVCKNRKYRLLPGELVIFNPGDSHSCESTEPLVYRGINISKAVMSAAAERITGKNVLPVFSENVIYNKRAADRFRQLHCMITGGSLSGEKGDLLHLLTAQLIEAYARSGDTGASECCSEVETVCSFVEKNYMKHMTLKDMCRCGNMSSSTLLRAFAAEKGITPYRYLLTVRISRAKELLRAGAAPVEAAMQTGFSDQSHFTSFFNMFTGVPPAEYSRIFKDGG